MKNLALGMSALCMIVIGIIFQYTAMHNMDMIFNANRILGENWTDITIAGIKHTPDELYLMSLRLLFFSPLFMVFGGVLMGISFVGWK